MCDLGIMTTYIDNFSYSLLVFLFQPIIEVEITLKSLHINDSYPIKYIKTHITENLSRLFLIGLNHI